MVPNPQYECDHRQDDALFLDSDYLQKKLRAMRNAYEKYKALAAVHAGPALIETFGENPFHPASCPQALQHGEDQQSLSAKLMSESAQLM